jgi:hypothetical protein
MKNAHAMIQKAMSKKTRARVYGLNRDVLQVIDTDLFNLI